VAVVTRVECSRRRCEARGGRREAGGAMVEVPARLFEVAEGLQSQGPEIDEP